MPALSPWALHSKQHWYQALSLALAVSGIPSLVILGVWLGGAPFNSLILPWLLFLSGAVVALVVGYGIYWWDGQKEIHTIQQLIHGELWANWQFSPSDWEEVLQRRSAKSKWTLKDFRSGVGCALPFGLLFGGGIMLWAYLVKGDGRFYIFLLGVGILLLFPAVAFGQGLWSHFRSWLHWQARNRNPEPRLFVGPRGLYHEVDGFTDLRNLQQVALKKGSPKILKLKFRAEYQVIEEVELPRVPSDAIEDLLKRLRGLTQKNI